MSRIGAQESMTDRLDPEVPNEDLMDVLGEIQDPGGIDA